MPNLKPYFWSLIALSGCLALAVAVEATWHPNHTKRIEVVNPAEQARFDELKASRPSSDPIERDVPSCPEGQRLWYVKEVTGFLVRVCGW